jgi:predicted O-methyltransferase YrrM
MKTQLTQTPATDPVSVYRYRDGLYAADLLAMAIVHLDLFTWLNSQPATIENICSHFEIHPRPADVMVTLFVAMGLLERKSNFIQVTRLASEHLVSNSPWFLGPYYASLKDRPVCADFLKVLRTDKPANWGSFKNEKDWARAMEDEAFANSFTAAMDCRGVYLAQAIAKAADFSRHKNLLDIAGGSGIYACSLAAHYPNLRATVFEKPPVDQVAKKAIAKRGFTERVDVRAGDMFKESFPRGFDLHLISNVLHDWDEPTVEQLLRKSFEALDRNGLLIIHDAHINPAKTGPLPVAAYSAMLMHATEGKCYSLSEIYPLLERIGFRDPHFTETAADRGIITAAKPG